MTTPHDEIRPDLGYTLLLAKELVGTLYALNEVGWVYKNISFH
jgi:hypothetical protein